MQSVYLAGPIKGLPYNTAQEWRNEATKFLDRYGIVSFNPLRGKDFLEGTILGGSGDHILTTQPGIVARDLFDVQRATLLLVYLLGAEAVSIGTVCEIAVAHTIGKPVILVIENEGNVHDHTFIRQFCPFRTDSLQVALETVCHILLP